jgi:hypothetical protein
VRRSVIKQREAEARQPLMSQDMESKESDIPNHKRRKRAKTL